MRRVLGRVSRSISGGRPVAVSFPHAAFARGNGGRAMVRSVERMLVRHGVSMSGPSRGEIISNNYTRSPGGVAAARAARGRARSTERRVHGLGRGDFSPGGSEYRGPVGRAAGEAAGRAEGSPELRRGSGSRNRDEYRSYEVDSRGGRDPKLR